MEQLWVVWDSFWNSFCSSFGKFGTVVGAVVGAGIHCPLLPGWESRVKMACADKADGERRVGGTGAQ